MSVLRSVAGPTNYANPPPSKFHCTLVGLLTLAIDLAILNLCYHQGFSLSSCHIISFLVASGTGYLLNSIWSFKNKNQPVIKRLVNFIITIPLILFLRGGILASLKESGSFSLEAAMIFCAIISSIGSYLGSIHFIFSLEFNPPESKSNHYHLTIILIIYSVLLRFFYLGPPELFYEEAYYWNYAKHLDIGYLDHPPMVAWIIGLFTNLMGDNEFAVRFGAFSCWSITAYFSFRLTREIHGQFNVSQTVLLIATLPVYFAVGWVMTPDAPLIACWAAALYYFYRALIHEQRAAWVGIGISIGLGMLSKYTIVLLGLAALLFILADRHARKWIFRLEPYLAILIAIILFSPVIVWNVGHEWASFLYQGRDRMAEQFEFSLPLFIASIILIITPTGFLSVVAVILHKKAVISWNDAASEDAIPNTMNRGYFLLLTLTLLPVAIFLTLSLFRETKFHWTAPCWLGIVPYIASIVNRDSQAGISKLIEWSRRAWPATILICLICYGAALHYLTLGFPGVPYPKNLYLLGWQGFGREIEALVKETEHETGDKIWVVGMDRNRIASGLAFYRTKAVEALNEKISHEPAFQTSSWHLFGGKSLMYEYWFPIEEQSNKTMLLVSRSIANLTSDDVLSHVRQAGDIKEIMLWKNGKPAGVYYYLLVKGYRNQQSEKKTPSTISSD
ncbi:MAG: glycosyltransferase family 39 protein [Candidatus Contendobacter sp.]|nr:glycosyltransferase family 39 protein [Candidatus Contendobacter sp.]MDG4555911.1 glycosyltransferase family 39 protein [Candidatus Contendobacter sp.]